MIAGGHVFLTPQRGLVPTSTSKVYTPVKLNLVPSIHPPAPKPAGGFPKVCNGCGGNTDAGLPAPVFPRDNIATQPAGPVGLSSGVTNPLPPTRAGITDFGSGISTFGGTVAKAPPLVSVADTKAVNATAAAPEPTNNNAAIALAGGAVVLLLLGAIFL